MIAPTPNPVLGTTIHAIGGISASTCYVPFQKVRNWSWESYWIIQALFAWMIMPVILGFLTVPDLITVFKESPKEIMIKAVLLGAAYGFGGMSFGYAIRHIGFSLTYTISIGISAILGTLAKPMLDGELIRLFQKEGGEVLLFGMIIAVFGVAICGWAGFNKERDLRKKSQEGGKHTFNMSRGLTLTIIAGVLSAVFGLSLDIGQPVSDVAAQYGAGHFEGNSKIILSTMGCLLTNLAWFIPLSIRNKTLKELRLKSGGGVKTNLVNYLLAALSGSLWYFQFFFYGLANVRMGVFEFASWVIHMSMLIFFSYIIGVILKEWIKVTRKTYIILVTGLLLLFVSFLIMNRGMVQGEISNGEPADIGLKCTMTVQAELQHAMIFKNK
jgi:L-rhamnose-H+ transport protein